MNIESEDSANPEARGKKILVVDDELEMRVFLCNLLKSHGYLPLEAGCGAECLSLAVKEKPALIILDAMLANAGEHTLYRRLKQDRALQAIPVLMLSNVDQTTLFYYHKFGSGPSHLGLAAPEGFLKKPLEADDLIHMVRGLTGERSGAENSADLKRESHGD